MKHAGVSRRQLSAPIKLVPQLLLTPYSGHVELQNDEIELIVHKSHYILAQYIQILQMLTHCMGSFTNIDTHTAVKDLPWFLK